MNTREVTWKCSCSVYQDPQKRFTEEGCGKYFTQFHGIGYDPFPFGTAVGDRILAWPIMQCSDGEWRPEGIEECSYVLANTTVLQFIARDVWFIELTTGHLKSSTTKYFPIVPKALWKGKTCNQCGICCAFPRPKSAGGGPCQYLKVEQEDRSDRFDDLRKRGVQYAKKDKLKRYSKDGKSFLPQGQS